tara:strand:- start:1210 stop:1512 length:303 start_codon:yes stop_codon:yes gene_type:complete
LIKKILKGNNTKIAETLCGKFDIPIDDFPQIVSEKKKGSIRFYLSSYLKKNQGDVAFRGLNRVEEMFHGLPEYLVMLCEALAKENRMDEVKGIYIRNGLK